MVRVAYMRISSSILLPFGEVVLEPTVNFGHGVPAELARVARKMPVSMAGGGWEEGRGDVRSTHTHSYILQHLLEDLVSSRPQNLRCSGRQRTVNRDEMARNPALVRNACESCNAGMAAARYGHSNQFIEFEFPNQETAACSEGSLSTQQRRKDCF
jgi:hypothetical protein